MSYSVQSIANVKNVHGNEALFYRLRNGNRRERKKDCIRTITKPFVIHIILLLLSDSLCFSFWTADGIVVLYIALAFIDTRKPSTLHEVSLTLLLQMVTKNSTMRFVQERIFNVIDAQIHLYKQPYTNTHTDQFHVVGVKLYLFYCSLSLPFEHRIVNTAHICRPLPWCALICIGYVYFYFLFMMFSCCCCCFLCFCSYFHIFLAFIVLSLSLAFFPSFYKNSTLIFQTHSFSITNP